MAVAVLLASIAPETAGSQEQKIVVLVNDTPITAYDIEQRVRLTSVTTRQQPSAAMRKKVTDELISETIQLQEARKYGIRVRREEIDKALDRIGKNNNLTGPKLVEALSKLGVNARTMRQKIEASLAWQRVIQGKFRNQVNIGDADVDKALSDQDTEASGKKKTEFHLQRVRLALPENPDQEEIARRLVEAEELRERVTSCEQLENALRKYSKASVKSVGRKSADQVVQPSRALLTAAKVGHLTPAYIAATGVELYAVCGRRSVNADDSQRQKVQARLVGQEYEMLALRHLRDLRQEAFVEYR